MSRPGLGSWHAQVSPTAWERNKREKLARQIEGRSTAGLPGFALIVEALLVTGVLAALATVGWHVQAPDVFAEVTDNGVRVPFAEARQEFGVEAWFAVVTAIGGAVAGVVLMLRHTTEAVLVQALLVGTGIVGALLVWLLGRETGPGDLAVRAQVADSGTMLEMPLDVASYAMFAIWPIAAAIAGAAIIAMRHHHGLADTRDPRRRRRGEPDEVRG